MLKGGPKAVEQVLHSPKFPARERIHRNKPALIALQLAARPRGEAQFKACSEYSPFLQCAALRQIPPEDLAERMASVKLKDAKASIRAVRQAARSASRETGAPQTDEVPPPAPEKAPKVLEGTPEVWTQIVEPSNPPSDSEAANSKQVSEPARNPHPPNQSPAATSSPATAPKKVDATTDARVKSPVIGFRLTIFDEAGKHPVNRPLNAAQAKALLAVDPTRFRLGTNYLQALASALKLRLSHSRNRTVSISKR